jgi:hypothetical protein
MSTPEEPPKPRESRPPLWWLRLTGRDRGSTEPDGGMPSGEPGPEKWPKETMPFVPVVASPETAVEPAAERIPTEEAERVQAEPDPSSEQDASAAVTAGPESASQAGEASEAAPEAPGAGSEQAMPGADARANGAVRPADSAEPRLQDPGSPVGGAPSSGNGHTSAGAAPEAPGASPAAASDGPPASAGSGPGSDRPPAADVPAASQAAPGGETPSAGPALPAADGGPAAASAAQPPARDVPAQDAPAADHVPPGSETPPAGATVPHATAPDETASDETASDETTPNATGPDATGPDATGADATGEPVVGRVLPYGTGLGVDLTGPTELDRPRLARAAEPMVRQQLSEWVEIAHRSRVPSLSGRQGSDGSESISAAAVRAIARLACGYVHSDSDEDAVADQLMRNLISPPQISAAQVMQQYPTVTISKKQLRLDLARVEEEDDAATPHVELLRLPDQPELRPADLAAVTAGPGPATDTSDSDQAGDGQAEPEETGAGGGQEERGGRSGALVARVPGTAAIMWGPVAAIAAGHTYLSLDTIMAYARTRAFERARDQRHTPQAAALGMRAVRALEIVVLVSAGMRRALWIDVDPADGEPAAVTAIDLDGGDGPYDMAARLL